MSALRLAATSLIALGLVLSACSDDPPGTQHENWTTHPDAAADGSMDELDASTADAAATDHSDTIAPCTSCADSSVLDALVPGDGGAEASVPDADSMDTGLVDASDDAASPADAGGELADFSGRFEGTTSQGVPIRFDVLSEGLIELEFGWQLPACASTTITTFAVPAPIVDGHLERMVGAAAGGLRHTFIADFAIDSQGRATAEGTLDFTLLAIPAVPSCSGMASVTWTASRAEP